LQLHRDGFGSVRCAKFAVDIAEMKVNCALREIARRLQHESGMGGTCPQIIAPVLGERRLSPSNLIVSLST
jgi:hypothetical protein